MSNTAVSTNRSPLQRALREAGMWRYAFAVATVAVAAAVRWALTGIFGDGVAFITFYPAVAVSGIVAGGRAGVLATLLSAITAEWMFRRSGHQITASEAGNVVGLLLFGAAGLLISLSAGLLGRSRKREWEAAERARGADELRRSEARFRTLVTGSGPIVFRAARDGAILEAPGWELVTGQPPEAYRGQGWFERVHPEDAPRIRARWSECVASGEPAHLDYRVRTGNGEWRWMHFYGVPVRRDDGAIIEWVGTLTDIHDGHVAEEALCESRQRLERAQEIAHLGSWELDVVRNRLSWSDEVYRIFGLQPQQFGATYEAFLERVHPDDRAAVDAAYRSSLRENRNSYEIEHRVLCDKTGEVRIVHEKCEHFRDAQGRIFRSIGMVHDITERKRAEAELRYSEERFRAFFDLSAAGAVIVDIGSGKFAGVNQKFCDMTGYSREELLGMTFQDLAHRDDRTADVEVHERLLQGAIRDYTFERRYVRKDGRVIWAQAAIGLVRDAAGKPVRTIGVILDVTQRREFQAELERLVAERTAKLRELVGELEHFSYTITHDMRAPLRALQGFAGLMIESCATCDEQEPRAYLQRIRTSAERMDSLVTDALNYSRTVRQEVKLTSVDAGLLLRGMLDSYPEFQPSIAEIEIAGEIPLVIGNEAGLTQCFSNLLGNAVKFVKPGQKPKIRVRAERRDGWVRIWVEDEGIGISPWMLPRVFDMFSRGHPSYEGTGIGLALVRKVASRMGGKVGVEAEEGQGSRFWLELRPAETISPPPGHQ